VELARDCYSAAVEGDPFSYVALQAWGVLEVQHFIAPSNWLESSVHVFLYFSLLSSSLSVSLFLSYPLSTVSTPRYYYQLTLTLSFLPSSRLTAGMYQVLGTYSGERRNALQKAHTHCRPGRRLRRELVGHIVTFVAIYSSLAFKLLWFCVCFNVLRVSSLLPLMRYTDAPAKSDLQS
jgi:hypothetical protein